MKGQTAVHFVISIVSLTSVSLAQEVGINLPGSDLRPGFELSRDDPNLCKEACENDPACKAYTYVLPGYQGPKARCWLKSKVTAAVKSDCCVSGVREIGVNAGLLSAAGVVQPPRSATTALDLTRSRHIDSIGMEAFVVHQADTYLAYIKLLIGITHDKPETINLLLEANAQLTEIQKSLAQKRYQAMKGKSETAKEQAALPHMLRSMVIVVVSIQVALNFLTEQERQLLMMASQDLPFSVIAKRLGLANGEEGKRLIEEAMYKLQDLTLYFAAVLTGQAHLYQTENPERGKERATGARGTEYR